MANIVNGTPINGATEVDATSGTMAYIAIFNVSMEPGTGSWFLHDADTGAQVAEGVIGVDITVGSFPNQDTITWSGVSPVANGKRYYLLCDVGSVKTFLDSNDWEGIQNPAERRFSTIGYVYNVKESPISLNGIGLGVGHD